MTEMTRSTELLAFEIQKDGYEVTVKNFLVYLCCSNVRRLKVGQNILASDYEIYMVPTCRHRLLA